MQERDFKGIWIPAEIWLDERLNALDKVILAEINSLDGKDGCYASNDYIAEFCQCSASKVSKSIKNLIAFGYLYVESFDGRKRVLRSCLAKNDRQDDKICEADEENLPDSNIYNNKDSNKKNNTPYSPPRDKRKINEDFEIFWSAYPKKKNKEGARKAFAKVKVPLQVLLDAIERQKKSKDWIKDGGQYIPYPSTWLNNGAWEDEPGPIQGKWEYDYSAWKEKDDDMFVLGRED